MTKNNFDYNDKNNFDYNEMKWLKWSTSGFLRINLLAETMTKNNFDYNDKK